MHLCEDDLCALRAAAAVVVAHEQRRYKGAHGAEELAQVLLRHVCVEVRDSDAGCGGGGVAGCGLGGAALRLEAQGRSGGWCGGRCGGGGGRLAPLLFLRDSWGGGGGGGGSDLGLLRRRLGCAVVCVLLLGGLLLCSGRGRGAGRGSFFVALLRVVGRFDEFVERLVKLSGGCGDLGGGQHGDSGVMGARGEGQCDGVAVDVGQ